jgi:ATP-dependent exoDNAse (exonuclease V) beta subunit
MQAVGDALHAIIAASFFILDEATRLQMIKETLQRFQADHHLQPEEVAMMAQGLHQWLQSAHGAYEAFPEWPIHQVQANGQLLSGWIDLAVRTERGWLLIDHKSFPGAHHDMLERALGYSGQLAAYAHALQEATGVPVMHQCIHFVVAGTMATIAHNPQK